MLVTSEIEKTKAFVKTAKKQNKKIGFVPTMGYLHRGHLSLIEAAKKECDIVVVSIFVNPTQFGRGEDFEKYPRDLTHDTKLLKSFNIDLLFTPLASAMFPAGHSSHVEETELSGVLCGKSRPGHFRGVTTVVLKLFEIVDPEVAFFGQKDFQQQAVIKKMVRDLNLAVIIKTLPIVRETDGLAMSSRNKHLNPKQRQAALILYQTLALVRESLKMGEKNYKKLLRKAKEFSKKEKLFKLDYLEILDPENLRPKKTLGAPLLVAMAGYIGKTRLIDNLLID